MKHRVQNRCRNRVGQLLLHPGAGGAIRRQPRLRNREGRRLHNLIGTECKHFAGKRNNIAHGIVDMRFSDPPKLKLGYWLVPSFYATKKHPLKGPNAYAYTCTEIVYFIREFDRLWVEIGNLISDIAKDQREP
jgi:hypothetical protein